LQPGDSTTGSSHPRTYLTDEEAEMRRTIFHQDFPKIPGLPHPDRQPLLIRTGNNPKNTSLRSYHSKHERINQIRHQLHPKRPEKTHISSENAGSRAPDPASGACAASPADETSRSAASVDPAPAHAFPAGFLPRPRHAKREGREEGRGGGESGVKRDGYSEERSRKDGMGGGK
jgi:hypothetical protein